MVGEMFGPYRVERLLGRGGWWEVYRAYDTMLDRTVALKVLAAGMSADPMVTARIRQETQITARVSDPHLVPIHDCGEVDGRLFLDMRLIVGEDLAAVLAREGRLAPDRAVAVIEQVAHALDAVHEFGLVHRAVKPSNIMLTGPGTDRAAVAYLGDFDIAHMVTASPGTALTVDHTMRYMAPEQFMDQLIDRRVDVYALARVFHDCLTGWRPLGGEPIAALLRAHFEGPPPRPSQTDPTLPGALDDVVARGMATSPGERFPSAGAFAGAARRAVVPPWAPIRPPH